MDFDDKEIERKFNSRMAELRNLMRTPEFKIFQEILLEFLMQARIQLEMSDFDRMDKVARIQERIRVYTSLLNLFDQATDNLKEIREREREEKEENP